jgi:hypothetical protein
MEAIMGSDFWSPDRIESDLEDWAYDIGCDHPTLLFEAAVLNQDAIVRSLTRTGSPFSRQLRHASEEIEPNVFSYRRLLELCFTN